MELPDSHYLRPGILGGVVTTYCILKSKGQSRADTHDRQPVCRQHYARCCDDDTSGVVCARVWPAAVAAIEVAGRVI